MIIAPLLSLLTSAQCSLVSISVELVFHFAFIFLYHWAARQRRCAADKSHYLHSPFPFCRMTRFLLWYVCVSFFCVFAFAPLNQGNSLLCLMSSHSFCFSCGAWDVVSALISIPLTESEKSAQLFISRKKQPNTILPSHESMTHDECVCWWGKYNADNAINRLIFHFIDYTAPNTQRVTWARIKTIKVFDCYGKLISPAEKQRVNDSPLDGSVGWSVGRTRMGGKEWTK